MRTFVIRARSAPTDPREFLASVGQQSHCEILAHAMMNAIFVAQSHRDDTVLHLVLESSPDYSRTVSFTVRDMGEIGGFHEQALLKKIANGLNAARGMGKDALREVEPGVQVRTTGFEKLTQELALNHELYVLEKRGTPIGQISFGNNPCFLLTDHVPMPKKSLSILARLGANKISLGPRMLFASQCVVLIHNALDLAE